MYNGFNIVHITSIVIVICLLVTLIAVASTRRQSSFLDRFTNKLPVISGFFIAFSVFITYKIFKSNSDNIMRENTLKMIDRGWITLNSKIVDYYQQCPAFIDTLYYDWQKKALLNINDNALLKSSNIPNQDKWNCVNVICVLIFQSVEDFITIHTSGQNTSESVWIANFLQFLKSERVQVVWVHFKTNYDKKTIELIDYLIEMTSNRYPTNEAELKQLTNDIVISPIYEKIMTS
jgi:hypothetical protein